MKHQVYRPVAVMLGFLLTVTVPTQADIIKVSDVVQVNADNRGRHTELRLRTIARSNYTTTISGVASQSTSTSGRPRLRPVPQQEGSAPTATSSSVAPTTNSTAVKLTNATQNQDAPGSIETIELGEVTGTICDCGDIAIPGAGFSFPKLPLLALGLVPLAFLFNRGSGDTLNAPFTFATNLVLNPVNPISPTQPPPSNPIPEPATLLLFGFGLVAFGAATCCRRRTQSKDVLPSKA